MTLILGLRGKDGLVLAADSRGTIGDPRNLTAIDDSQIKLFELSRYCGLAVAGASELAAKCVDELRPILAAKKAHFADEILKETRTLARRNYDDWFSKFKLEERPAVVFILCGYQGSNDRPGEQRTYSLASPMDFAPNLHPNGNALAGVPQYATYLLNRLYNPDMTVAHLPRLAAYLIGETASQDPKVGGPIRIATITTRDGFKTLPQSEVDEIVKRNNEQNEQLRQFFFERDYDGNREVPATE